MNPYTPIEDDGEIRLAIARLKNITTAMADPLLAELHRSKEPETRKVHAIAFYAENCYMMNVCAPITTRLASLICERPQTTVYKPFAVCGFIPGKFRINQRRESKHSVSLLVLN